MAKSESNLVRDCTNLGADTDIRLSRFLKFVHPTKTADNVARDVGVARGTAKNWVENKSAPGFIQTLKLIGAYGPEFIVAVIPNAPRWLRQAYRDHQEHALTRQIEDLQRKRSEVK